MRMEPIFSPSALWPPHPRPSSLDYIHDTTPFPVLDLLRAKSRCPAPLHPCPVFFFHRPLADPELRTPRVFIASILYCFSRHTVLPPIQRTLESLHASSNVSVHWMQSTELDMWSNVKGIRRGVLACEPLTVWVE